MPRRRRPPVSRTAERVPAQEWLILVIGPAGSHPLELRGGTTRLPSGSLVDVADDRLQLRVDRAGATLNDVEVHGPTVLNSGDFLREGEFEYLVLPASAPTRKPTWLLEHKAWRQRVEEEARAQTNPFTVLVGRSGAFDSTFLNHCAREVLPLSSERTIMGTFGKFSVEMLVVGEPGRVETVRQRISDLAARQAETVRWGLASFPAEGATADELWAVAIDQMLGLGSSDSREAVWRDPYMTRLSGLAERWAGRRALLFIGSEGVGRETFARLVRSIGQSKGPFVSYRNPLFDRAQWAADVSKAAGGSLHVRRLSMLPREELRAFWNASSFHPSAGLEASAGPQGLPSDRIVVPDLHDRPADVVAIAERTLHLVDAQLNRRRSTLRPEARTLLQQLDTPENVRTLRNTVIRAALGSNGTEVWPEQLDTSDSAPSLVGVRAKVHETERRELETALTGSGWNVAEAARLMELPRRTLVYKIRRFGLRRPSRSE